MRFLRNQDGNFAVLGAILLLPLAAAAGSAVDLSRVNAAGSVLQDQIDGAALRAAKAARDAPSPATMQSAAETAARAELSDPSMTPIVTIRGAAPVEVEVEVRRNIALMFGAAIGVPAADIRRSATAVAEPGDLLCLLLLAPSSDDTWKMTNTARVVAPGCGAQVNSRHRTSFAGALTAPVTTAATYAAAAVQPAKGFQPAPVFNSLVQPDPLAGRLLWPTRSGNCQAGEIDVRRLTDTETVLLPGVYCGGDLVFGAGRTVTLQAGRYVIEDGDLRLVRTAVVRGNDVSVILLAPSATLFLGGTSVLALSAPTSGTWKDVALAVKPQTSENDSAIANSARLELDGVLYLPSQRLLLSTAGTIAGPAGSSRLVITRRLSMSGSARLDLNGVDGVLGQSPSAWLKR